MIERCGQLRMTKGRETVVKCRKIQGPETPAEHEFCCLILLLSVPILPVSFLVIYYFHSYQDEMDDEYFSLSLPILLEVYIAVDARVDEVKRDCYEVEMFGSVKFHDPCQKS
jgi:hypothetical protein